MKVYLASASDERQVAAEYMARLRAAGIELTLDWNAAVEKNGGHANRGLSRQTRLDAARADVDAVMRADVFWLVAPKGASAGCWFEFGIAHMVRSRMTKRDMLSEPYMIIASGDVEKSLFTELADHCFLDHEAALAAIVGLSGVRGSTP